LSERQQQGLYRLKPASQRLVAPLERWLVDMHVSPDVLTWSAVPVAAVGGACLALSSTVPMLLLAVPLLAAARLALNLLDGMVARRTGASHPMGEVWNELCDRIADALFIGGLAFVPAAGPAVGLGAVVAALIASYAGLAARAAGGRRQYGGIMSKPGRMATLAIAAPAALVTGEPRWLLAAGLVITVGATVTLVQRVVAARAELAR
jgi:phosphatidylglycerophosphate synthase